MAPPPPVRQAGWACRARGSTTRRCAAWPARCRRRGAGLCRPAAGCAALAATAAHRTAAHSLQVEQVSQLAVFIEAALNYHKQSTEILEDLHNKLQNQVNVLSSQPKSEFKREPRSSETTETHQQNGLAYSSLSNSAGPSVQMDQPCCSALYDFDAENEGELGFKEGDIITLTNQIDENWYEGMINGESGFFPINYVKVMVPLPQ